MMDKDKEDEDIDNLMADISFNRAEKALSI